MKRLIFIAFFIFLTTSLFAISRTYVGPSSGDWSAATNWLPAGVPTSFDEVTIPNGAQVIIGNSTQAYANRVDLETDGRLYIYNHSKLWLAQADPRLNVQGYIYVQSLGEITFVGHDQNGPHGLTVENGGWISNYGQITLRDNAKVLITTGGRLYNLGDLVCDYQGNGYVTGIAVGSSAYLYNMHNGHINVSGTMSGGIFIDGGNFTQFGTVELQDVRFGIGCDGNCSNLGEISISGTDEYAIQIEATFRNRGEINITDPDGGYGIWVINGGDFHNYSDGEINLSGNNFSRAIMVNFGGTILENEGTLIISDLGSGDRSISVFLSASLINDGGILSVNSNKDHVIHVEGASLYNRSDGYIGAGGAQSGTKSIYASNSPYGSQSPSTIRNEDCGNIYLTRPIELLGETSLTNEAWFNLYDAGANSSMGSACEFINEGVLEDFYEVTSQLDVDNYAGIIIKPLHENVTPHVPFYDPIMLGTNTAVVVSEEMYGGLPSLLRGTYDQAGNYWISDYNYNNFYLEFTLPGGCDSRKLNIFRYSNSPSLPQGEPNEEMAKTNTRSGAAFKVYPNPAWNEINVDLSDTFQENVHVCLQSMTGQTVLQGNQDGSGGQLRLQRPANLPAGTYLLMVVNETGEVETKRLIFQ